MADSLNAAESLRRLSDADYDIAPGEYDVRGWRVMAANDEPVGKVSDLIIEPTAGKVRYFEVDVDRKRYGLHEDRRILIPIGSARLDTKDKLVVLTGMTPAAISKLPDYTGANFDTDYDERYRGYLSNAYPSKRLTRSAEELRMEAVIEKRPVVKERDRDQQGAGDETSDR